MLITESYEYLEWICLELLFGIANSNVCVDQIYDTTSSNEYVLSILLR